MENEKIKIALVRGDSLNDWEGRLWADLSADFDVTAYCSKHNLYRAELLPYLCKRIYSSTDNRILSICEQYLFGCFQTMFGLEDELKDFDIVHTAELFYDYTNQAVRAKKMNPKLKVVATIWDNSFGRFEYNYWPGLAMPPAWWREKIAARIKENIDGVDLFLAVSEMSKQMLLAYGVSEKKIRIVMPAVVENQAAALPEEVETAIRGKELYLAVNRLVKEKGVYDLLYAWRRFAGQSGDKILLIAGSGPERKNLKRLASEWQINSSVIFLDYLPNNQLCGLYGRAKALILASLPTPLWQEQFGYVLAEAITNGCPVISTYSGAIPEVVGEAGILVAPGNPVEIFDALTRMQNEEAYRDLKEKCAARQEMYSDKRFRGQLEEIYKELMS